MRKKVLYKYFPSEDFFYRKRMVRISPRLALNDPFEIRPSIQAIAKYATKNHLNKLLGAEQMDKLLYSHYDDLFKEFGGSPLFNDCGVFCLSETRTNLLMWSHYANSHKGMVIGFDVTHPFFNQKLGGPEKYHGIEVGCIHRVTYDNFRAAEFTNPTDWYLLKSDEWIYEKEHRLILPLSHCDKVIKCDPNGKQLLEITNKKEIENIDNLGQPQYICLSQIPLDAICSITFGAEMDQACRFGIKSFFANTEGRHEGFKFELATISINRFELEIHSG